MEEDGYSLRTRRDACVGIECRMVFAIVGGGIYDGFFQFARGDGSACGVLYMGVYRIRGGHGLHREIVFPPDARRDARFRGGCDDRRFLLVVASPCAGDEFASRRLACVPVALGFLAGAGVLRLVDLILPHIHPTENVPDGPPSKLPRSALLVFAITLHNIPEGSPWA